MSGSITSGLLGIPQQQQLQQQQQMLVDPRLQAQMRAGQVAGNLARHPIPMGGGPGAMAGLDGLAELWTHLQNGTAFVDDEQRRRGAYNLLGIGSDGGGGNGPDSGGAGGGGSAGEG